MYHEPVMLQEVLSFWFTSPVGLYLDGTVGGGGHSRELLKRLAPEGRLIVLDRDPEALETGAADVVADSRVTAYQLNYSQIHTLPGLSEQVDGVMLDLGTSSHQLDTATRGFSFMHDGPLDMRMNACTGESAAQLIARVSEAELGRLLRDYGDVRAWRRLAAAIVSQREQKKIERTLGLAALVEGVVGSSGSYKVLSQVFQALRIAVNQEFEGIEEFLDHALDLLKPGGRLAIISFHSGEDALIKRRFRSWCEARPVNRHLPVQEEFQPLARDLVRGGEVAEPSEQERNSRARSARLRVVEKLQTRAS